MHLSLWRGVPRSINALTLIVLDILMYHTPLQFLFNLIYLQDSRYKHVFTRVENRVEHDQLASEKPADLDLHCFQNLLN